MNNEQEAQEAGSLEEFKILRDILRQAFPEKKDDISLRKGLRIISELEEIVGPSSQFHAGESVDGEMLVWHVSDPDNAVAAIFPGPHQDAAVVRLTLGSFKDMNVESLIQDCADLSPDPTDADYDLKYKAWHRLCSYFDRFPAKDQQRYRIVHVDKNVRPWHIKGTARYFTTRGEAAEVCAALNEGYEAALKTMKIKKT